MGILKILLVLFPICSLCDAGGLNFYISQQESYRVLGMCCSVCVMFYDLDLNK